MISEPDTARLKKLAEHAGETPHLSDGVLDVLTNDKLDKTVEGMSVKHPSWTIVVTMTPERPRHWWLKGMMIYFRNGLSLMNLDDGRLAICTWSVGR